MYLQLHGYPMENALTNNCAFVTYTEVELSLSFSDLWKFAPDFKPFSDSDHNGCILERN